MTDSKLLTGGGLLFSVLEQHGVEHIFGYPGGAIMPIYDALVDSNVQHFLCRHEQGASFSAVGYARASGKIGVCMATSGPGATNLITGLADALADSIPIVAITGQVPTAAMGSDAFQETDIFSLILFFGFLTGKKNANVSFRWHFLFRKRLLILVNRL